ncbi:MAG: tetratricopeptide repeat protein [Planctomycetes bacterium]|nr:tetratricopeptide repeat protein [Planctomycetota bacterium]
MSATILALVFLPVFGGGDIKKDEEAYLSAREALADGNYALAVERLSAFKKEFPDSPLRDEGEILLGRAHQLSGHPEQALESLAAFVKERAGSPLALKARWLLADAYVSLKRFGSAGEIYRARLEFLRGDAHQASLAGYYLEIADPAFEGKKVQDPSTLRKQEITVRDYKTAIEYYLKARQLVGEKKLPPARALEIRYRIGKCHLELGQLDPAIQELKRLIAEKPSDQKVLGEALFALGQAWQRKNGPPPRGEENLRESIAAFERLENDLGDHPRVPEAVRAIGDLYLALASQAQDPKAVRAHFDQATAAYNRLLARFPQHELAPKVAFAAAEARARFGDRSGAIARFRAFLERYRTDESAPLALFRIGELLEQDQAFDEAIGEWKRFLGLYPNDSRWTASQQRIIEAAYKKGLHLLAEKKQVQGARAVWEKFLAEYPLSELAPQVYRHFYDLAIGVYGGDPNLAAAQEALRTLAGKYAESPLAPSSQLLLANLLRDRLDDLDAAIREYEVLIEKFPQSPEYAAARQILLEMKSKHLALETPRSLSGAETWKVKVLARNLEKLRFKAYRLNLEEYFRKKKTLAGAENVAVAIVEPTRSWEYAVGEKEPRGYRPYKLFESEPALPLDDGTAAPGSFGAAILTAEEEALQAVTLVLRSDLGLVTKAAPKETFVWAFNERSGEPWAGVQVLLADGEKVFFEGKTGPDGALKVPHESPRTDVRVLALAPAEKGVHYASSEARAAREVAYGYTPKAHVTCDRPLYRPGQTVRFRAMLRQVVDGRYQSSEGEKAKVSVVNPLGVILFEEELKANEFGAVSGEVGLDDDPPLGDYQVLVGYAEQSFEGKFKVEEYRKPEFSVGLKTERRAYLPGEAIRGGIECAYLFGKPVPQAKVQWQVFDGPYAFDESRFDAFRWFFQAKDKEKKETAGLRFVAQGEGVADAEGRLPFEYRPAADGKDHTFRIAMQATDLSRLTVNGMEDVLVTRQEIYVVARAEKKVYRPGDKVTVTFQTVDAASQPADVSGDAVLAKRVPAPGKPGAWFDREVKRQPLATKGGKGEVEFRPAEPGEYRVLFSTRDRAGTACEGGAIVRVAGDEPDLAREAHLLAEKAVYRQGEEARFFLSSPVTGRHALLTFEGEKVIDYRVLKLERTCSELAAALDDRHSPNVTAAIAIPSGPQVKDGKPLGSKLYTASDEILVLQYLNVAVEAEKEAYRPGDEGSILIHATDQGGREVEAELSLAVIDAGILQLEPDRTEAVKPFFYDQRRELAVATGSSYSFVYQGVTSRKSEEVIAEELRENYPEMKTAEAGKPEAAFKKADGGAAGEKALKIRLGARKAPAEKAKDGEPAALGVAAEAKEDQEMDKAAASPAPRPPAAAAPFGEDLLGISSLATSYGAGRAAFAAPRLRRHFADTAFWSPAVRTGKDGRARVSFTVPDNLTRWRAAAVGATRGSLVGDGEGSLASRQDLLVRVQAPRFLTHLDRSSIVTPVHNYLPEAVTARLEMEGKGLRAEGLTGSTVRIGAGEIAGPEWDLAPVQEGGRYPLEALLTVKALSEKVSDAVDQEIPVIPFGKRNRGGSSGLLRDRTLFTFSVAAETIPGSEAVWLEVHPRFDKALRDAVLYLRWFPYGCTEQTVSGLLGLLSLNEALDRLGTPDQDLRNLARDQIPKRIAKLLNYQRPSGGWGWWSSSGAGKAADASDPWMTAYALFGLERARLAGFRVQADRLEKARQRTLQLAQREADPERLSLILYALSFSKKAPAEALNRLHRGRDGLRARALGRTALALKAQDYDGMAIDLARVLKGRVKELLIPGGDKAEKDGKAKPPAELPMIIPEIPEDLRSPEAAEATAWALLALDALEPEGALNERLAAGLLSARAGIHWGTTPATALAVSALSGHASLKSREAVEAEISVDLNGEVLSTLRISPARKGDEAPRFAVPREKLRRGENRLALAKSGRGELSYLIAYEYVTPAERLIPEGNLVKIARDYRASPPERPEIPQEEIPPPPGPEADGIPSDAPPTAIAGQEAAWLLAKDPPPPGYRILDPKQRPAPPQRTVERLPSGEKMRVQLLVTARDDLSYVLIEDPLPAGCEVVNDSDERFTGTFDRKEVRDDKVVFFRSRLPKGTHEFSYLARAVFPGAYRALPALAGPMYQPEIAGLSSDHRLEVLKPEKFAPEAPVELPAELTLDQKLYRAERLFRDGKRPEARPLYLEILQHPSAGGAAGIGASLLDPYHDLVLVRLVAIDLELGESSRAIRGYEELRRRNPNLLTAAVDLIRIGAAYASSREDERAWMVWRELVEREYGKERQVAETIFGLGQHLRAQTLGFGILLAYPDTSQTIAAAYQLSQRYATLSIKEEGPRGKASKERVMFREAVDSLKGFVGHFPKSPYAPEASLLVLKALESLGGDLSAAAEAERFERRYEKSPLLDDAIYLGLEASFRLGNYPQVIEGAQRLDQREYLQSNGQFRRSEYADQALYLLAKTYHVQGRLEEAIPAYQRIAGRFPDAAETIAYFTAVVLEAPAVLRSPLSRQPILEVHYQNLEKAAFKAYRVDLPMLFATRKSLGDLSAIDLAGIDPVKSWETALPGGGSNRRRRLELELPLQDKGVYWITGKAGDQEIATVLIRSDLELEVQRAGDKVRAYVYTAGAPEAAGKRRPVEGAYVKIAAGQRLAGEGRTDARGLFEAVVQEGQAAILAEHQSHYAWFQESQAP